MSWSPPAQLLTNGAAGNAIQSAVEAWKSAYTVYLEWLQLHPRPAENDPELRAWQLRSRQLGALVRDSTATLQSTVQGSDHEAQKDAYERAEHDVEQQELALIREYGRVVGRITHGEPERVTQTVMQTEVRHSRLP